MATIDAQRAKTLWYHPVTILAARVLIGGTFILSAVAKLPHHSEFVEVVKSYDLLTDGLATVYGNALPWIELFVGVYLLLGILVRPAAVLTLLVGISFLVANTKALATGDDHCGSCFGDIVTLPIAVGTTLDILLLGSAAILVVAARRTRAFDLRQLVMAVVQRKTRQPGV